jgi:hypothetical protein
MTISTPMTSRIEFFSKILVTTQMDIDLVPYSAGCGAVVAPASSGAAEVIVFQTLKTISNAPARKRMPPIAG